MLLQRTFFHYNMQLEILPLFNALSCTAACFNHIGQAGGHVSAAVATFKFNIISTTKSA